MKNVAKTVNDAGLQHISACIHVYPSVSDISYKPREAPIRHWPIISRLIIGA